MLKDPTQRSRIQKAMPALEQDELPADEDERKICAQLHESVAKTGNAAYIKEMNEETAIRFCRGYVFGSYQKEKLTREVAIQKTIDVLHKCLEWRVQRDVSTLCERDMPKRHLYKKLWVNGVSGVDKNGRQIWVLHTPSKKIMTQLTGEELLLNHFKDFENLARRKTEHALKRGYPSFKHVAILDLGQESMALKVVQYMQKTLTFLPKGSKEPMPIHQSFYPECMKTLWIINTPLVFKAIYTAVKAFIHPVTREKFRILGSDYLQKMAEEGISKDALPKYLGGTGPDPEGFHYKIKVSGGKEEVIKMAVRRGDRLLWDIEVEKKDAVISGFIAGPVETLSLVEAKTLEAGGCIRGERTVERDGEVRFVFSNKHTRFFAKIIRYDVRVVSTSLGTK